MRQIKPGTLDKCLRVLKEMKYMADNKLKMDPKVICVKNHTSQALPTSAKRVGFFTSDGYARMWRCKKERFDPLDARKVLDDVYDNQKPKKHKLITPNRYLNKDKNNETQILFNDREKCELHKELRNENVIPPRIEDVEKYCNERKNTINPAKFMAFYGQNGWRVGKENMKNWKLAIITWEKKNYEFVNKKLSQYSDQEVIDDLKRRGYSGLLELNIKKEISF